MTGWLTWLLVVPAGAAWLSGCAGSGGLDDLFERIDSGQVEPVWYRRARAGPAQGSPLERGLQAELSEHLG